MHLRTNGLRIARLPGFGPRWRVPSQNFDIFNFLDVWPRLIDQNQKLRIALVIIFSLRIRQFQLEPRISQQMMSYKQISIFRCLRFFIKF